ncbi:MAG: hypothetical protein ISR48_03760 [Alphaproteobacteria bacterium]|nr:hypothetical protein [Alphaproteobacteria bacterium]
MTGPDNLSPLTCIEDLARLPPQVMTLLCKTVDGDTLMVALKGAPEDLREAVFAGFPPRRAGVFADTLSDTLPAVGPVTPEQLDEARRQVIAAANILVTLKDMTDPSP